MIEQFIHTLIGPSGVRILEWYVEHNLYVNGLIVLIGLISILAPRQTRKLAEKLNQLWNRTPFALEERDRIALEKAKARRDALKGKKKHEPRRKTH